MSEENKPDVLEEEVLMESHFFITDNFTWQQLLNLAKDTAKFSAPGSRIVAHSHKRVQLCEFNKCRVVKSVA